MRKTHATAEKHAPARRLHEDSPASVVEHVPSPGNGQHVTEEEVQLRAYQKWEAAGKPGGDGIGYWLDAERELLHAE